MPRWFALSLFAVFFAAGPVNTVAQSQDAEEQAIRRVIENATNAINNADLTMLLAQIAEDALIDSKIARAKVTKQKYAEVMAAAFRTLDLIGMEAHDIKVTTRNPTRATVLATIYPMKRAQRFTYQHEWALEKRDGRWLIVETTYKARVLEPVEPLAVA